MISLPKRISNHPKKMLEKLRAVILKLQVERSISGILLGGSVTYKDCKDISDYDIFCLVKNRDRFDKQFSRKISSLQDLETVVYQGDFPWTEKLYTLYFNEYWEFSIDVCLIDSENADKFFWEPNGYILYDLDNKIEDIRSAQMSAPLYCKQPFLHKSPYTQGIITLKKIYKNLVRGHLWNAIEQVNILRRYSMQIIRIDILKDKEFLGRVDRDIENILSQTYISKLSQTIPSYNPIDIARKTNVLLGIFKDNILQANSNQKIEHLDWIQKHLAYEKKRLNTFISRNA